MRLYHSVLSPFSRKVRAAAVLLGLRERLVLETGEPGVIPDVVKRINPLGKIPVLVLDDGRVLYDSPVIAAYLDHVAGGGLIPVGEGRFEALRLEALGDGLAEAAVLWRRLGVQGESDAVKAHVWSGIERGVAALEEDVPSGEVHVGTIAIVCALEYLILRGIWAEWPERYPKLGAWFAEMGRMPCLAATRAA